MPLISVVAPVYNELRITLHELVQRLGCAIAPITGDYEIILVDDGSRNDAWEVIRTLSSEDIRIRGIRLARNFGQHVAITAGVDHAEGDWVVVMDSDLQDRPEVIPELYAKAQEGYDIVFVNRASRPEPALYRFLAASFYRILNLLSGQEYNRLHGNFSIASASVVRAFQSLREQARFYGGLLRWVGFQHATITAEHGARFAGKPSYSILKRAKIGFNIIAGFSTRLLYISIVVGLLMAIVSFVMAAIIVVNKLADPGSPLPGWPSVMTAIFFTAGVTNVALGLLGVYVAQIFQQTKLRPLYIISEEVGSLPVQASFEKSGTT
jgi:polyisoprenyl-phosphate glycosyltransferase